LNLLIGIGVSVSYFCIREGKSFHIGKLTATLFLSFIVLGMSLISNILAIALNRFRSPKILGVLLIVMYAVFMVIIVFIELGFVFTQQ